MLNVVNEGQPFWTVRKVTEDSLREADYEPEDKGSEGNPNNVVGHAVSGQRLSN